MNSYSPAISRHSSSIVTQILGYGGVLVLFANGLFAQDVPAQARASQSAPQKLQFEVEKSRSTVLEGGGEHRSLTIQQVKPPILPAPPEVKPRPPVDPVLAEQRRAYWRSIAPLETRLVSLHATIYENGMSFLSWGQMNQKGEWEQFEAWSGTDFSSLWMAPDFDIGRTRYYLFSSVMKAGQRFVARHPLPGPLDFAKGSGFVLTKGDPTNRKALAPINALHELYRMEGAQYALAWTELQEQAAVEAAWLKANPPVPKDLVIRMWPKKSRRHVAEANTQPSDSPTR